MVMGTGSKSKRLSRKQMQVIDDLFESNQGESYVLKKHKISVHIYRKWLDDKDFVEELAFRNESARRQCKMIVAKFSPAAAIKLVKLTQSEKEETARKACLDIIAEPTTKTGTPVKKIESVQEKISPEAAGRLLAAMAEERRKNV